MNEVSAWKRKGRDLQDMCAKIRRKKSKIAERRIEEVGIRMRFLDTREQKSPQFLMDGLKLTAENIRQLEVGDYQTYEVISCEEYYKNPVLPLSSEIMLYDSTPREGWLGFKGVAKGHCVEHKIGTDVLDWDRLRDECYRMLQWKKKNPYMDIHAVWVDTEKHYYHISKAEIRKRFVSICSEYYVWPHIRENEEGLIAFLKKLEQPKAYQRDTVYMKRTDEPIYMDRVFRGIDGVSSELAVQFKSAEALRCFNAIFNAPMCEDAKKALIKIIGKKKDGFPKKLYFKVKYALENGRLPNKKQLNDVIEWYKLETGAEP